MEKKHKTVKTEDVPLEFEHKGVRYYGMALPLHSNCIEGQCYELDVMLNNEHLGTIYCDKNMHCRMKNIADQELVNKIGEEILLWYS